MRKWDNAHKTLSTPYSVQVSLVQSLSCVRLCDPLDRSTPGLPAHLQLPEFTQTHVHWVSIESVMPSDHLILCCPLLLPPSIFLSIRVFSNELALHIRQPNYWTSGSASVLLMNIQDWFPLGLTGWIPLQSKGLSRVFSSATIQKHQFLALNFLHGPTLTSIHDNWKTIALTRWTFVGKVMTLLFNMLSRLLIAFLPRRKCLLISWLQSPSAVIWSPRK